MSDIVERLRREANRFAAMDDAAERPWVADAAWAADHFSAAANEIVRLREALENIVTMRPTIPQDEEGNGPNWQQYIYTRTWALFAADLQDVARAALKGGKR